MIKKLRSILSIIIITQLLIIPAAGSFAEDETGDPVNTALEQEVEQTGEQNGAAIQEGEGTLPSGEGELTEPGDPDSDALLKAVGSDEEVPEELPDADVLEDPETPEEPAEEPEPDPVSITAFAGYNSVVLKWNKTGEAENYRIYRKNSTEDQFSLIGTVADNGSVTYTFRDANAAKDAIYNYYVTAVKGEKESEHSNTVTSSRVRTIYYRITFKNGITLKSKDKAKKKATFGKGTTVYAEGFNKGYYIFYYGGRTYNVAWNKIKGAKADYRTNAYGVEVDNDTAEDFVNAGRFSSKTKYLIWISLYSQRVFVFQGSTGKWNCIKSWQCNSGRASTPTETGLSRKLYAKYKKNSKHKYWSRFSRNSAIHGRNKKDAKLGKPISGGCVRVDNDNALFVMKSIPKKTRVVVF